MLTGVTCDPAPLLARIAEVDPILAGKCIAAFPGAPGEVRRSVLAALLNGLRNSEVGLALQCAWQLRDIKDPAIVPDLLEILSSGKPHSRLFTALILTSMPDARAVPGLIRALSDKADVYVLGRVSEQAAKALAAAPEGILAPLSHAIRDGNEEARTGAATALGGCGAAAVPILLNALDDAAPGVRAAAARSLGKIGDASVAPQLAARLFDTAHASGRQSVGDAAAEALGQLGAASVAIPAIEAGIRQGQQLRYAIIDLLQDTAGLPILEHAIVHGDSTLRLFAVRALERMNASGNFGLVMQVLEDRDASVRGVGAEVLKNLGWEPSNVLERTLLAIARQDWKECVQIGPAALPHLFRFLDDPGESTRKHVIYALGSIKDESAVPHLIRRLREDSSKDTRAAAAGALIAIGSEEAISAVSDKIIELLRNKREALEVKRWTWFDEEDTLSWIYIALEQSKNPVAQRAAKKLEPKILYGWRRPLGSTDPLDT
jgi:HEAT repeat protein